MRCSIGLVFGLVFVLSGCSLDKLLTEPQNPNGATPGLAVRLEFTRHPSGIVAGEEMSQPVEVTAVDPDGRRAEGFTGEIVIAVTGGSNGASLQGTRRRRAASGVAAFDDLSMVKAGTDYRLEARATGLVGAASAPFDVAPAPAAELTREDGNAQEDTVAATLEPYQVLVTDEFGNPIEGAAVVWAVTGGGGTIVPDDDETDDEGIARAVHKLGTTAGTQTVTATVTAIQGGVVTFTAMARHASMAVLRFVQEPSSVREDERIDPPVEVAAEDQFGNRATDFDDLIEMSLVPLTGNPFADLEGRTIETADDGLATFDDLRIDRAGFGFRLRASAQGLSVESQPFTVYSRGRISNP